MDDVSEFDYQWANIPDLALELNQDRIKEFLGYVQLPPEWFRGKLCLDAGCGSGRWTWAMMQLGAKVISLDVSDEALRICGEINPGRTFYGNLMSDEILCEIPDMDFVLCWGVLHHLPWPYKGFIDLAGMVKPGGYLHIMVYHQAKQLKYIPLRRLWKYLNNGQRLALSRFLARLLRKTAHGWWDALNPRYNHGYFPRQIRKWFINAGFENVTLTRKYSINMRGQKPLRS